MRAARRSRQQLGPWNRPAQVHPPSDIHLTAIFWTLVKLRDERGALALKELRVNLASLELGVVHDTRQERNCRCYAFDDETLECDLHAPYRLFASIALTYQLCEQRIVVRRYGVSGVHVR